MSCRPHRWNVEDWLPLYGNKVEETAPEIRCLNCGRVLAVRDTTPNMRGSITEGNRQPSIQGRTIRRSCKVRS